MPKGKWNQIAYDCQNLAIDEVLGVIEFANTQPEAVTPDHYQAFLTHNSPLKLPTIRKLHAEAGRLLAKLVAGDHGAVVNAINSAGPYPFRAVRDFSGEVLWEEDATSSARQELMLALMEALVEQKTAARDPRPPFAKSIRQCARAACARFFLAPPGRGTQKFCNPDCQQDHAKEQRIKSGYFTKKSRLQRKGVSPKPA
jgi:hypothetical protein